MDSKRKADALQLATSRPATRRRTELNTNGPGTGAPLVHTSTFEDIPAASDNSPIHQVTILTSNNVMMGFSLHLPRTESLLQGQLFNAPRTHRPQQVSAAPEDPGTTLVPSTRRDWYLTVSDHGAEQRARRVPVDDSFTARLLDELCENGIMPAPNLALFDAAIEDKATAQRYGIVLEPGKELAAWGSERPLDFYALAVREGSRTRIKTAANLWIQHAEGTVTVDDRARLLSRVNPTNLLHLRDHEVRALEEFAADCRTGMRCLFNYDDQCRLWTPTWMDPKTLALSPCVHCRAPKDSDHAHAPWFSLWLRNVRDALLKAPSASVVFSPILAYDSLRQASTVCGHCFSAKADELKRFQKLLAKKVEEQVASVSFPYNKYHM